jgi:hypothetical protein
VKNASYAPAAPFVIAKGGIRNAESEGGRGSTRPRDPYATVDFGIVKGAVLKTQIAPSTHRGEHTIHGHPGQLG